METYLPYVWYFVLAGLLLSFVVLTGTDLGLGIISLFQKGPRRAATIEAVGPQWYANETWLVIAGGTLFGAFPHAFGLILSSLYVPAMLLIFGLMLRAVSAEFRHQTSREAFWSVVFGAGCLLAALGLGFLVGGLLTNPNAVSVAGAGSWGWLNPISACVAAATAVASVSLGAAQRLGQAPAAESTAPRRAWRYSIGLSAAFFIAVLVLVLAAPSQYHEAWTEGYRVVVAPVFAAVTLGCLTAAWLRSGKETPGREPFLWTMAGIVAVSGMVLTLVYPYIIPFSDTLRAAAAPGSTQLVMVFGEGIVLPIIIFYNVYVARVFSRPSGEAPPQEG